MRVGALGTLQPDGTPFVSLVTVATAIEGHPLMLLSALSAHTQHLATEPRVSLLLAQGGKGDPLAHPRLTLTGRAERIEEATREGHGTGPLPGPPTKGGALRRLS